MRYLTSKGITLIELAVVLAVVGVLVVAMGFSFEDWISKYKAETRAKELQVDLMNARALAMQTSLTHFINASGQEYSVIEDTDEDGALSGGDTPLTGYPKDIGETIMNTIAVPFSFDHNGLSSNSGVFGFSNAADPDFNCVEIDTTRINIGKWNETEPCETK